MIKRNAALWIAFLTFASLGLFDSMLGIAWPSMRAGFGVSLDSLGLLLLFGVAGYTLASSNSGWLVQRFGLARLLIVGTILRMLAMLAQAATPLWGAMIGAFLIGGLGSGSVDAGLNTYVATRHSARQMNWLHAFYGVGTTIGPLIMTAFLVAGFSWRWGWLTVAGLLLVLLALFIATRNMWSGVAGELDSDEDRSLPYRETLRLPAVWLAILLFFFYTGVEVSAGQWSFTLFTEGRGISTESAGFWVGLYWGAFTLGRFVIGFLADRFSPAALLRTSFIGIIAGLGLMWWNPSPQLGLIGFAFSGLATAAVFPTLLSDTATRLGRRHAPNAIGMQVAAAGLGVGILTGGVGLLAERLGLESIGLSLFVGALLMTALYEGMLWAAARRARRLNG